MLADDFKLYFNRISKHFVALTRWVRPPDADQDLLDVSSCFVLELDGIWFLVTAGHVIRCIDKQVSGGYEISNWVLEDNASGFALSHGVPYHLTRSEWIVFYRTEPNHPGQDGMDYAATIIDEFTVRTLKVGGIEPITENVCRLPPFDSEVPWLLMGVPAETVKQGKKPTARLSMIELMPCDPPSHIESRRPIVFYGKYTDNAQGQSSVSELLGMSGGPIFCTSQTETDLQYAAIGVQSGYVRSHRVVTFCPIAALSIGLRKAITALREREWSFSDIATHDPERASRLESAPPPEQLATLILQRFEGALDSSDLRVGWMESRDRPPDSRIVLQFHVGEKLYDQFFNARTGYRARFRFDWRLGFEYNRALVEAMRDIVAARSSEKFAARHIKGEFEDCGKIEVTREQVLDSLAPDFAKLWWCGHLMSNDGHVRRVVPSFTGPRIQVDVETRWAGIFSSEVDAWLDLNGAFLGEDGPYQLKDPVLRAMELQADGEA
jgi:hypothetical protein